jgi:uncharacterized membrane protein
VAVSPAPLNSKFVAQIFFCIPCLIWILVDIAVVGAGGTPALRGMQDFGMGPFNGWDDFQDVVIEFLVLLIGDVERS